MVKSARTSSGLSNGSPPANPVALLISAKEDVPSSPLRYPLANSPAAPVYRPLAGSMGSGNILGGTRSHYDFRLSLEGVTLCLPNALRSEYANRVNSSSCEASRERAQPNLAGDSPHFSRSGVAGGKSETRAGAIRIETYHDYGPTS